MDASIGYVSSGGVSSDKFDVTVGHVGSTLTLSATVKSVFTDPDETNGTEDDITSSTCCASDGMEIATFSLKVEDAATEGSNIANAVATPPPPQSLYAAPPPSRRP